MDSTEQSEQIAGNIQTAIFTADDTGFQSKKYFVTYHIKNNESFEQAFERLENLYVLCDKYIFGEEYGKSGNTPHIQGAFILSSKMRANTIQKEFFLNGVTLRKLKNWDCAFKYCQKEGNNIKTNCKIKKPVKIINKEILFDWQNKLIEICLGEPDDRKIYWVHGKQGAGKTQFIKYMVHTHGAIILNGKPSDMKNGIIDYMSKNSGETPHIILSNIGFDKNLAILSYSGYEDIKDMCFYSGKYEGGMVCGNNPHLIIFSNGKPATDNVKFEVISI